MKQYLFENKKELLLFLNNNRSLFKLKIRKPSKAIINYIYNECPAECMDKIYAGKDILFTVTFGEKTLSLLDSSSDILNYDKEDLIEILSNKLNENVINSNLICVSYTDGKYLALLY